MEEYNEFGVYNGVYDEIDQAAKAVRRVMGLNDKLSKRQSQLDGQINDILHEIEIDNLDAVSLMHWASQLRKALRERRKVKTSQQMIRSLQDMRIASSLDRCVKNAQKRPEKMSYFYRETEVPIAAGKKIA